MAYNSVDDLFSFQTVSLNKLKILLSKQVNTGATSATGRWHEANSLVGSGGAMTLTGTAGWGVVYNSSTAGAVSLGAAVSPAYKYLLGANAWTNGATIAPAYILLTDILHIYTSCSTVTAGSPTTINSGGGAHPTWTGSDTRMASAKGVQVSTLNVVASSTAPQIQLNYNDESGNTTGAQTGYEWGPVAATPAGCFLTYTSATATMGNIYMPLAAGDLGIQRINSYTITTGGGGSSATSFILHRPICTIPISAAYVETERDYLSQGIFPRIYDDTCLGVFVQIGGALTTTLTTICLELDIGWG